MEDWTFNLKSVIDNGVGYRAVESVAYDAGKDAARTSIKFLAGKTRNAERIELFCNSAESEETKDGTFVCSQLFRQVRFPFMLFFLPAESTDKIRYLCKLEAVRVGTLHLF